MSPGWRVDSPAGTLLQSKRASERIENVNRTMAIVLVAVLLTLLLSQAAPELNHLRRFGWLDVWLARLGQPASAAQGLLLALLPPLLICALVQYATNTTLYGLSGLLFAIAVLFYTWGPRDLDRDVDAVIKAADSDRRLAAAQDLRPPGRSQPVTLEAGSLVEACFESALARWFGVLFWFVLLGPVGALLYRLTQLLAFSPALAVLQPAPQQALAERLARVLDWAPAHLMALALALASDFDAVRNTWRNHHEAQGQGYFTADSGFLAAIARASVDADVIAGDGYAEDLHNPLVELADARRLIRRVLMVWLTLLALLALAGWLG
jgi:AmpE protein